MSGSRDAVCARCGFVMRYWDGSGLETHDCLAEAWRRIYALEGRVERLEGETQ